ncbi:MAG: SAM-dependent methyltransferase [Alphaproteobacteria bacterium]|nr:SAM-dependent methyltransferase [Alphaproteobacteria bacterium]MCY4230938.1 SAM-dependent methyltransferase [Alphaproteobacteria bacterium]MCY4318406.1 SAM-dependent methyltransferase [Alphaproteobacteria bacterium]
MRRGPAARIARRIERDGPMPLAEFMALSNAAYYAGRDPFGRGGDFTTAPEVSQMFGEIVGLWCVDAWQRMGRPADIRLIELGPGRGVLMADALRAARLEPAFRPEVHLVEISPVLRHLQLAQGFKAVWHNRPETIPDGPSIWIANEFFDALPTRQFVRLGGYWHERLVDKGTHGFRFVAGPALRHASAGTEGGIAEVCSAAASVTAALAARPGYGLAIDYGYGEPPERTTLQAVSKHEPVDPLSQPGEADMSAHVDFAALARAAREAGAAAWGPVAQGDWLRRLGIEARAAQLGGQETALARLTGADAMGHLFRVLAFGPVGASAPAGFTDSERQSG